MSSSAEAPPQQVDERTCPTCGREFGRAQDMKIHHVKAHGERLVETGTCQHCGETFEQKYAREQSFCSQGCANRSRRNRVEKECAVCGDVFSLPQSKAKRQRCCSLACRRVEENIEVTCEECEEVFTCPPSRVDEAVYCSHGCRSEAMKGTNQVGLKDPSPRIDVECKVCYKEMQATPYEVENGRRQYCSKKCHDIGQRRRYQNYTPRPPRGRVGYERLVKHCYFREGHNIDATHRIVQRRLEDGEQWSRDDVEELTGEMLWKGQKADRRLLALRPEDLGLSPIGGSQ